MIPTEEETQKIQEAQLANPDIPLGSAEQFLLTLSSISELSARLQLWAFKMDYEATEKVQAVLLTRLQSCEMPFFFGGKSRTSKSCAFIPSETDTQTRKPNETCTVKA